MESPTSPSEPDPAEPTWEWGIVEIFGHIRHAGKVSQEERFGVKMARIDVPDEKGGWTTHYYGGAAIFSYRTTDHATVLRMNNRERPHPLVIEHGYREDETDDLAF